MEKAEVKFKPEIVTYLNKLVLKLFEAQYFGFMESAIKYKDELIDYIESNISIFPKKITPLYLTKYGSYYMFYKTNKRTTWYIFYEKENNKYLVTFITNNHEYLVKYL